MRTEEWEKETDELIDALFLQLNNELAWELSDKHQRIEAEASGSGSGRTGAENRDMELPRGPERKIGVNSQRQGLRYR